METVLNDIRYGLRTLRKNPGFTAVAVLALALGIASTTAIFSVIDEVLLHPLPYPDSNHILNVSQADRVTGERAEVVSPANYLDYVAQNQVFSEMAAARAWDAALTGGDHPERVRGLMTTASFFPLFRVNPLFGRWLLPDDGKPGNEHVVVMSYNLWQRRFGADRNLVGQNITLNGEQYTVVGVMPPNYAPGGSEDTREEFWVPSAFGVPVQPLRPKEDPRPYRDWNYLDCWARLKPGVTLQQARAQMDALALRLEQQYPDENKDRGVSLLRLQETLVGNLRPVLLLLLAAVSFVLLIGCANVANLLLARTTARAKEISIRTALGASRMRVIRQFLTESILLALMGGALGLLLAAWAVPALITLSPRAIRDFKHIGLNFEVLAFCLGVSTLSGVLFGLMPALQASSRNPNDSLKEGGRGSTEARRRTRAILVVAEVGLSLLLLIGAGLMLRSFAGLMKVDPGFETHSRLVFNIAKASSDPDKQIDFYRQVVNRLQALPGVVSAGAVSRLPLSGGNSSRSFKIAGLDRYSEADVRVSTPDYFRAMGIPLIKGRLFTEGDKKDAPLVAIVNQELARREFPGQDPIGQRINDFGPNRQMLEIVGVVGNVRHLGLDTTPNPEIYQPVGQASWFSMTVVVASATSNPATLTSAVQNAVWSIDRNVPISDLRTMQDVVAKSVLRRRFTMLLLIIFAALALLLATIGLYGVMSYFVSQRTHEIGIRMALGAQKSDVLRLVVGEGMLMVGTGVLLGILAALALTRMISGLLFGVSATDPLTFVGFAALLVSVALIANFLPAKRATEVDPMVALRYE
jgi:putative ABC transport system permease protein